MHHEIPASHSDSPVLPLSVPLGARRVSAAVVGGGGPLSSPRSAHITGVHGIGPRLHPPSCMVAHRPCSDAFLGQAVLRLFLPYGCDHRFCRLDHGQEKEGRHKELVRDVRAVSKSEIHLSFRPGRDIPCWDIVGLPVFPSLLGHAFLFFRHISPYPHDLRSLS